MSRDMRKHILDRYHQRSLSPTQALPADNPDGQRLRPTARRGRVRPSAGPENHLPLDDEYLPDEIGDKFAALKRELEAFVDQVLAAARQAR